MYDFSYDFLFLVSGKCLHQKTNRQPHHPAMYQLKKRNMYEILASNRRNFYFFCYNIFAINSFSITPQWINDKIKILI